MTRFLVPFGCMMLACLAKVRPMLLVVTRLWRWTGWFFAGLLAAWALAAEPLRKPFDIPAGLAPATLKQFSAQAGGHLLYSAAAVEGVRTNPVKGRFAPREALDRMVADTGLVVVEDEATGALMINRAPPADKSNTSSSDLYPQPSQEPFRTVKRKNPLAMLGAWIALALTPGPAAQAADNQPVSAQRGSGTITGRVQNRVTGQYLNNARVSIQGTELVAFTDPFGTYRLVGVPSGPVVLEVFYTDLDLWRTTLNVPASGVVEQDVGLSSVARYGTSADTVNLDPFLVSSDRETDAEAIAINEQRFAPNIKNVMSTESLGNVVGNAVGEFLKFMPGLTVEYGQETIFEVSVRGIGGGMTSFTADGAPMVSVNMFFGGGRTFNVDSLSLNDISRIEVTKVPTPATAADSLAGSINMVSKSAFERSRAQLRYGISLVGNSENLHLKKTPFSNTDAKTWAVWPNVDFDYTLPIGKNFGLVITGMHSDRFLEQHLARTVYNTGGTGTGASLERPYLRQFLLYDGPARKTRQTLSLKADWRVSKNGVLSLNGQWNRFRNVIGTLVWDINVGTNGNSTVAGGVPLSYGEDYTIGATGRGAIGVNATGQTIEGGAELAGLKYRYDDGRWKVETGVSYSSSDWVRDNFKGGHLSNLRTTLMTPVRVVFRRDSPDYPSTIQAFDNANREIDIYDIDNYRITTATNTPYNNKSGIKSGNVNLRRTVDAFSFPASIQVGAFYRLQTMDVRTHGSNWEYPGTDGNVQTFESARPYLFDVYRNQDSHYGFKNVPWVSPRKGYAAIRDETGLFVQSPAQIVAAEAARMTNSEYIQEAVSAYYVQLEANFFRSRLKVLTGLRFESTEGKGEGSLSDPNAVYVRNPDGSFARDAQGNRIRRLDAGAVGSMAELRLMQQERAAKSERSYDGYYPSLHLNYSVSENFLLRAAYARTYGRPAFADIIPRTVVNQANLGEEELDDPSIVQGTLTVRNSSLRPWTADNYDLSAEYYTPQGGLFSAGIFLKEIKNFFGNAVRLATLSDLEELGLDPMYVGWNLSSKFNAGDARVSGAEFNFRHSLRFLGPWGNYFTVFANATKLKLEGNPHASFTSFIPESGNWGASYSRKRLTILVRWNYRGLDKRTAQPAFGPDAFTYIKSRITTDLSMSYQLTPRLSLAASVNNVFNVPQTTLWYGSSTPAYAKQWGTEEFGIPITIGIKGTF